jgi:hypothetical protein
LLDLATHAAARSPSSRRERSQLDDPVLSNLYEAALEDLLDRLEF